MDEGDAAGGEPPREEDRTERDEETARIANQLRSRNPKVRESAVKRLGQLKTGGSWIIAAMRDRNPFVRSAAAEAAGYALQTAPEAEREAAVHELLYCIDDPNRHVAISALRSLGKLRAREAAGQVAECLGDEDSGVAAAAIDALGLMEHAESAPRLADILASGDRRLRCGAARALGHMGHRPSAGAIHALLEELLPTLGDSPSPRDLSAGNMIVGALGKLEYSASETLLIRVARDHVGIRSTAVDALARMKSPALLPHVPYLLNDPSESLRRSLVRYLGDCGDPAAVEMLIRLLADGRAMVRTHAVRALRNWEDDRAVEAVRRLCYLDSSPAVRPEAVETLAHLAGEAAAADLERLAADPNPRVRVAALRRLGRPIPEGWDTESPPAPGEEGASPPDHDPQAIPPPLPLAEDREDLIEILAEWREMFRRPGPASGTPRAARIAVAIDILLEALEPPPAP